MTWQDDRFEHYLREFQPPKPRALPWQTRTLPELLRRLAAAAVVTVVLGTSLWFAMHPSERGRTEIVTNGALAPEQKATGASLSLLPLTQLAVSDPVRLDAQLAAASRRVLPDFRGERSTLRVLAKE